MGVLDFAGDLAFLKVLDNLGVGASQKVSFTLLNSTLEEAKNLISQFSVIQKWGFIKEDIQGTVLVLSFQVGQWGFSISGSQRVYIVLNQNQLNVEGVITSKSTMGQLVDWGANKKNTDLFVKFVNEVNQNPGKKNEILSQPITLLPAKSTINRSYFLVIAVFFIIIIITVSFIVVSTLQNNFKRIQSINSISNNNTLLNSSSSKVLVVFKQGTTHDEIVNYLVSYGAYAFTNDDFGDNLSYVCSVPTGQEVPFMSLALKNPKVINSRIWYDNPNLDKKSNFNN